MIETVPVPVLSGKEMLMHNVSFNTQNRRDNFSSLRSFLFYFAFYAAVLVYFEMTVYFCAFGKDSGFPLYTLMFSLASSILPALLCWLLPYRAARIVTCVVTACFMLFYDTQLVYEHIFDSFFSLTQLGMGVDAVRNFSGETLQGIAECALPLGMMLLPLAAAVILAVWHRPCRSAPDLKLLPIGIALFAVFHFGTVLMLPMAGTGNYTPFDIYHTTFVLRMSERYFGILTSARLEIQGMLFPHTDSAVAPITPIVIPSSERPETEDTMISAEDTISEESILPDEGSAETEPPVKEYPYQVTDIDFTARAQTVSDARIRAIDSYFSQKQPNHQNAYTGMFSGYHLIVLCCESFSPYVIDSERTPVLARMANEGFIFTNYYNTVCDNTSNGEYALCTGLLPGVSLLGRGWDTFYHYNSFTSAEHNLLPFCLGNQLRAQGYQTYAIHNYYGNYYDRNKTHPNMGYTFRAMAYGLKRVADWPTSDVSMMEQSLPLYLTPNEDGEISPFHVYYLTFSGHMSYNFSSNDMAIKNRAFVEELPYSESVRAYLACQQELEYALEYLIDALEEAGQLENTLIALTADHYPYNLGLKRLGELAGETLDGEFDKYRGSFLLWNAKMEEPITVDTPCCTLDILPTLSNLMGLTYDSRLLIGSDIFSDAMHIAILDDRSFVTDSVRYNAQSGEVTLLKDEIPEGYLDALIAMTRNAFTLSTEILYTDYYRSVYNDSQS